MCNVSGLDFLSEAAKLAYQGGVLCSSPIAVLTGTENGQQVQTFNHVSTAPTGFGLLAPFPSSYMGMGQLRDVGTGRSCLQIGELFNISKATKYQVEVLWMIRTTLSHPLRILRLQQKT